jgi:hypothetical protein
MAMLGRFKVEGWASVQYLKGCEFDPWLNHLGACTEATVKFESLFLRQ